MKVIKKANKYAKEAKDVEVDFYHLNITTYRGGHGIEDNISAAHELIKDLDDLLKKVLVKLGDKDIIEMYLRMASRYDETYELKK